MPTVRAKGSAVQVGGSVDGTNFWTYRNFSGNVKGRVRDISRADGTSWQYGSLRVLFIAENGVTHMTKTLSKVWGVTPNFATIGSPVTNPVLRMKVSVITSPGGYAGQWSYFDLELTW